LTAHKKAPAKAGANGRNNGPLVTLFYQKANGWNEYQASAPVAAM